MTSARRHFLSRRGFCLCCLGSATFAATGGWLTPREAFAEARNVVDSIRDDAARAPIKVHKLRRDVSILEGSGGNIAVLTGSDAKVFIDAGTTASRPRILKAANSLSRDPIRHLINAHWHFDHRRRQHMAERRGRRYHRAREHPQASPGRPESRRLGLHVPLFPLGGGPLRSVL